MYEKLWFFIKWRIKKSDWHKKTYFARLQKQKNLLKEKTMDMQILSNEIGDITYCPRCYKIINNVEKELEKTIGKNKVEKYRKSCLKRGLYGKKIPKIFAKVEKKYNKA